MARQRFARSAGFCRLESRLLGIQRRGRRSISKLRGREVVLNKGIIMISELENAYGSAFTPQELGKILKLDRRTVIKYAEHWGGVEVAPGTWRFFEKRIKEVLNAEQGFEKRHIAIQGKCDGSGTYGTKAVSGCEQKVTSRGPGLGKRSKKRTGEKAIPDKFGIFSGGAMG